LKVNFERRAFDRIMERHEERGVSVAQEIRDLVDLALGVIDARNERDGENLKARFDEPAPWDMSLEDRRRKESPVFQARLRQYDDIRARRAKLKPEPKGEYFLQYSTVGH
jgi:hypothetical protein